MDLEVYRNFLAIVESGSITGASEYVHIAQPALSKQIKTLENTFDCKLLITSRGSRQLFLTEEGRILYQKAKYMCALEDLVKDEIDELRGGTKGTLRFSIANSRAQLFIEKCIKDFSKLYPNITYELYEAGISEQTQQLLNGITELGIFSTPVEQEEFFDVLFRRDEQIVAVFHKDSEYLTTHSHKEEIEITALTKMNISISAGCCNIFKSICAERGLTPTLINYSTTRSTALVWAKINAAVAIVPIEPEESLDERLVVKKIKDLNTDIYKTIVKVKDRPLSAVAKTFLKYYAKTRNSQHIDNLNEFL